MSDQPRDPVDRLKGEPINVHCPGSGGMVLYGDHCAYCAQRVEVTDDGAGEHSYDDVQARWRRGDFGRESWLNGHLRNGDTAGNVQCVGCGMLLGVGPVWITQLDVENPPAAEPDWPFEPDDCPVCAGRDATHELRACREEMDRWQGTSAGRVEHRGPLP